jgi:hypothetical protein
MTDRVRTLFGPRSGRFGAFAFGPYRQLVGRAITDDHPGVTTRRIPGALDQVRRFDSIDLDGNVLPARITGTARGSGVDWIAVVVNDRVAGLARVRPDRGAPRFAAMVAPALFRSGRNEIELFSVEAARG